MKKTAQSLTDLIGGTPLLELNRFAAEKGLARPIIAKLEYFNPGGSAKDRIALAMIRQAEEDGTLKPGATIIEPTSGNTGVGLALVAAVRGYRLILTMPETMSIERRKLVSAYGAQVVLTPAAEGMTGAIKEAERLRDSIDGAIILQQFSNRANPAAHFATTGPEIWNDTEGHVDVFVAGAGTGGTISGVGRYLKSKNPAIRIVAAEPASSPVLSGGKAGAHAIQGIGAGFVPEVYDSSVVDEVITVSNDDAMSTTRLLARSEGLLTGISSGAAAWAAAELARREELRDKTIVTLLPDTGERYLSTGVFG
ncbi:cysteine synthase A [Prevotella sp. HCN-7019]|uniref:cysteine synthase A n=1 Tax=Prevotella sp. HCN-7019 TaxID=3134668 RepID=UPI0030BDBD00